MERILALKRVAFFRNLPLDTLARVDRLLEEESYDEGEIVTGLDGRTRYLCILLRGSVILERDGQAAQIVRAQATFGEGAVIDEDVLPPRAIAREPSIVLRMSSVTFNDLAREHPQIWMEVCRVLARRLEAAPTDELLAA
jgi:CRP-like cAMP-binding protein